MTIIITALLWRLLRIQRMNPQALIAKMKIGINANAKKYNVLRSLLPIRAKTTKTEEAWNAHLIPTISNGALISAFNQNNTL